MIQDSPSWMAQLGYGSRPLCGALQGLFHLSSPASSPSVFSSSAHRQYFPQPNKPQSNITPPDVFFAVRDIWAMNPAPRQTDQYRPPPPTRPTGTLPFGTSEYLNPFPAEPSGRLTAD
ncbi:unnamed protein product [Pleuronectes platessa]|uniref:Uncharacterized protein n=1 Tax=Pleuronectes platessa TaxID=8262 RepID=A0A9N7Y6H1_PLEPL|nr:unnamed protein product [Pleuronectes platessa]